MNKFILILPIVLVLLVSGCTQQTTPASTDPVDILKAAVENMGKNDFSAVYKTESKTINPLLGGEINSKGTLEYKKKGNNLAIEIKVKQTQKLGNSSITKDVEQTIFVLNEGPNKGIFSCGDLSKLIGGDAASGGLPAALGKTVCINIGELTKLLGSLFGNQTSEANIPNQYDLDQSLKLKLDAVKSGKVTTKYVKTEVVAGNTCDELKFEQTVTKLDGTTTKVTTEECIDRKTGFPLKQKESIQGTDFGSTLVLTRFGDSPKEDLKLPYEVLDFTKLFANQPTTPSF